MDKALLTTKDASSLIGCSQSTFSDELQNEVKRILEMSR